MGNVWWNALYADSFLERAFLRWVLAAIANGNIAERVRPQHEIVAGAKRYHVDYAIIGDATRIAVELDGFAYHGSRHAFSDDRLRQNDLTVEGWTTLRFSFDAVRRETARCAEQLRTVLAADPGLAPYLLEYPFIEVPDMKPDPEFALGDHFVKNPTMPESYFERARAAINTRTLRECQREAYEALQVYYGAGGMRAACVMSVGAGKTLLGVLAALGFGNLRVLIITPGSVIRGTFDRALDYRSAANVLYNLPNGPLLPGCPPPVVMTLDRDEGAIRSVSREELLAANILVTNFHSLGTGAETDDVLAKLGPDDIDMVIVDEAHIAASESYQRAFAHFATARALLMSACFQRLDGRPIEADVVYRYRLVDSIADGNAKNLRVHRFAPSGEETVYEMVWPDGGREEIHGRDALIELLRDERKLARVTARSDAPIRQIVRIAREALDRQTELLAPIKPRVLFSALGERHAEQIARIACEHGIPSATLHHTMSEKKIRETRERYELESGDLQGIVQLKMLGQGYDFPPISVVCPMRPYGSFSEFYQFIGRGIRVLQHPALAGRVSPADQFLDIAYHVELGLDRHFDQIYLENDMDPITLREIPESWQAAPDAEAPPGTRGASVAERPEAFVLFESGSIERRIIHDEARVEQRRSEREVEALSARYAKYAQSTQTPVTFDQYIEIIRSQGE